ncbi:MAG TPA: DUF1993 domain-containing protein [Caulobacteraceae bacterium]|nr:DUF1993 domain-containing protein [Caulobacteraceae bacterium]
MAVQLYDLTVATYLQTLGAVNGFLERGAAHCRDNNIDPEEIVETRLWNDMLPFRFQLISVAHHSAGAIEGVKAGAFAPPSERRPLNYPELQGLVAEARAKLAALSREEVNALEGKDVTFAIGDYKVPFIAENFLMSFSMPNFYFHATTAYDILRSKGVPLGKRDFMGQMRTKS